MPPLLHSVNAFSICGVSFVWFPRALTVHVFPLFAGPRGAAPHDLAKAVDKSVTTTLDVRIDFMARFDVNMELFWSLSTKEVEQD